MGIKAGEVHLGMEGVLCGMKICGGDGGTQQAGRVRRFQRASSSVSSNGFAKEKQTFINFLLDKLLLPL